MRREALIYGLVFLAIVGAGIAFVLPRLTKSPPRAVTERPSRDAAPPATADATPPSRDRERTSVPDRPVVVRVTGVSGALRGPLRAIVGAEVEALDPPDAPAPRFRLVPRGGRVSFGFAGHRWTEVLAADLVDDMKVVLPDAAPPLVLRVREADGTGAPDVPVRVLPETPGPPRRTDASGALVVDDAAPGLLVLEVGGSERRGPTLRVVAGATEDARATLEPAWRVVGRVVSPDARPVEGARVRAFAASGEVGRPHVTAADGRFAWIGPASHPCAFRVEAEGWAERAVEAAPPAIGSLSTDLGDVTLRGPGGRIDGHVRAAHVDPDATVSVEPAVAAIARELFGPSAALDVPRVRPLAKDGTFAFDGLPVGIPLRTTFRGAGLAVDDLGPASAGTPRRIEQEVPAGRSLVARVVDAASGKPVPGLVVLVSTRPIDGDLEVPGDRRAVTDADGRLAFRGLPDGAAFLRAYASGRRSLLKKVDLPHEDEVPLSLEPAITDAARRVAGVVVDDAGTALRYVTVRAAGIVARTDAAGAFVLEGVESVAPKVTLAYGYEPGEPAPAGASGHGSVARVEIVPGGAPLRLVLPRTATLRLKVLDGITDEPIAFFHALVVGDGGAILLDRAVATRDGTVEWTDLASRVVTVTIVSFGRRGSQRVGLEPGSPKDLGEIRLAHGVSVRGRVHDVNGAPIANATVAALDEGWLRAREGDPLPLREMPFRWTRTAEDGTFALSGLDAREPPAVCAWAPGYAPGLRRLAPDDVRAASGPRMEASLDVRLVRGGSLLVHLAEVRSGRPVSGAVLDLEDARRGANLLDLVHRAVLATSAGSTEDWVAASEHLLHEGAEPGRYHIGPVEPGPYRLLVDQPAYRPERRNLTVLPPGEAIIGVRTAEMAPGAPGTISLLVELERAER